MLRALQIENYALIRSLQINFDSGFNVITGETGAGKSILMGALSLILGNRADASVLYDKTHKCIVEGTFDIKDLQFETFFADNDLDYQNITAIRREINDAGKSRAFINDTPVTLNTLKEFTSNLIDIHSQHQNLLLQNALFRLNIIDQFAQNGNLIARYKSTLNHLKNTERQYDELQARCTTAAQQQEYNAFTVNELEQAQFSPTEQTDIEQNIKLLSNAENIKTHLYQAAQILSEQETDTVLQLLKSVHSECASLNHLSVDYQNISSRIEAVEVELKDIAYEIVHKENDIEVNPQELERLNDRLDLIYTLQHKYQVDSVQKLLDLSNKLKSELAQFSDNKEQLAQLDAQCAQLHEQTIQLATEISRSRTAVLEQLQSEMKQRLQQLGMPDSVFTITLKQTADLQNYGIDNAEFLFSANSGMPAADLEKIASGGEMSRVMLALKSIITDSVLLPTVIFDEIDTGISGETATKVASVMKTLSLRHQLIVITHLPQIAVKGNQHFLVYKEASYNQTITNLKLLTGTEREKAVAVMLSGSQVSEAALATAKEMLSAKNNK